ncbi:hypothetical protein [Acetobacter oryzifermentans]|uniref:DNA-binding protein n=1 Tax=Acetobacter oryzifermentans TaxID=1633874 RepID=A0ABN4NNP3_9PROT|nr:hypothetical protein [Acetobacter oryzifermentans]ANA13388.1 hypothetical protein WG31_04695 [Acetobacter oryzifermentans]
MTDLFPTLLTLAQVLEHLKGIVGRTYLLQHLRMVPEFEGHPTHRRIGRRIVFYPADVQCLLSSLEERPERPLRHSHSSFEPSADKAYDKAVKLLKKRRAELAVQKKAPRRR